MFVFVGFLISDSHDCTFEKVLNQNSKVTHFLERTQIWKAVLERISP